MFKLSDDYMLVHYTALYYFFLHSFRIFHSKNHPEYPVIYTCISHLDSHWVSELVLAKKNPLTAISLSFLVAIWHQNIFNTSCMSKLSLFQAYLLKRARGRAARRYCPSSLVPSCLFPRRKYLQTPCTYISSSADFLAKWPLHFNSPSVEGEWGIPPLVLYIFTINLVGLFFCSTSYTKWNSREQTYITL